MEAPVEGPVPDGAAERFQLQGAYGVAEEAALEDGEPDGAPAGPETGGESGDGPAGPAGDGDDVSRVAELVTERGAAVGGESVAAAFRDDVDVPGPTPSRTVGRSPGPCGQPWAPSAVGPAR